MLSWSKDGLKTGVLP